MKFLEYKSYTGSIEYSREDNLLYGRVMGINGLISYEGRSGKELESDFKAAIDTYIAECKNTGVTREIPFKGSFNVRVSPELHQKAALLAIKEKMSLNRFVAESIREQINKRINLNKLQANLTIKLFMAVAIFGFSLNSFAQEDIKILKVDSMEFVQKSAEELENRENLDAENIYVDRHPNDTEVGSFEIRSSNENFLLRIGGFAKLAAYWDAGLENELFFDLYKINTSGEDPLGRFNLHAFESRLNMEVFGKTSLGLFRIFIEGDFLKDNNGGFRLRHAIGQFKGFTFGQTWTYFMDLAATPVSIDFYGTNASTFARKPLIRYKYVKEDNFEAGLSVENPNGNIFRNQNESRPQIYPDVVGKFTKFWGPHHLQVAGIFRTFIFKNTITDEEKVIDGYGFYLSGSAQIISDLKFFGQVAFGKGIGDYIALGNVLLESGNGDYAAPRTISGVAGVNYEINYRSQVNIFGSYVNLIDTYQLPDDSFNDGFQVNANYLYNILPNLKTGAEIIYGNVMDIARRSGSAARFYIMFQFDF